ncbi:MAG: DUF6785 family protein, partial [Thermodesulfobacteriota bacterium]
METYQDPTSIRLRALIIGLLFAVGICLLSPFNNIYRQATPLGGGHFPLAPFFIFLILVLLMCMLNRFFTKTVLSGLELLIIWIQMVIGSGIAYTGLARTFLINLTAPYHFATSGNRWKEILQPLLPASLTPTDPICIELLYSGLDSGGDMGWLAVASAIPWAGWIKPLSLWGGFILLSYIVMICLINLFSRQWIHNERMNFPLLKVPEILAGAMDQRKVATLFANHFLIAGLTIPIVLHILNGLHFYIPSVPQIPTLFLAGPYVPNHGLFSGFAKLKLYIYPAFIGFAFLTSRQISFSFWFFFLAGGLFYGILNLLGYSFPASELGITFGPTLSHPEETQMIGAYGIFFLFIVWLARHHLIQVARESFFLSRPSEHRTEWI